MSTARVIVLAVLLAVPRLIEAQPANPLLDTLSTRLGISTTQAGRGVGAVLAMARGFLTEQDYRVIAAAVPDAEQLAQAATAQGVVTRPIDDKDDLAAVFDQIGIPADAAARFVPVMRAWLVQQGAPDAGDLVSRVM
jgi:hypothetical protein